MSNSKLQQVCQPTVSGLYYVLGNLRAQWEKIGYGLKIRAHTLEGIKSDFKLACRCMIEMFESWINNTIRSECKWSTIVSVLKTIDQEKLAKKVEDYTHAEKRQGFNWLREEHYGRLGTRIKEHDEHSIFECLKEVASNWYEIGCLLHLSKKDLDNIERCYTSEEMCLYQMIRKIGKAGRCTWAGLEFILQELDLCMAADDLKQLATNKGVRDAMPEPTYRKKDFIPHYGEKYYNNIRAILNLPESVRDEDMISNLTGFLVQKKPSQQELALIADWIKKIAEKDVEKSDHYKEIAKELAEDMKFAKKVRKKVGNAKIHLEKKKSEIEEALEAHSFDEQQVLQEKLQSVQKSLDECKEQLGRATTEYDTIKSKLETCRDDLIAVKNRLNTIKSNALTWKSTKELIEYVVSKMKQGAAAGAVIGTFLGPGVGTVVGGVFGAGAGALYGLVSASQEENPIVQNLEGTIKICKEGVEDIDRKIVLIVEIIDTDDPNIRRRLAAPFISPTHLFALIYF